MFIQNIATERERKTGDGNTIRITLSFKDKIAANAFRRQLFDLSHKIAVTLQTILCVWVCEKKQKNGARAWTDTNFAEYFKSAVRCLKVGV